jgi:hypothetical protein
VTGDAKDTVPVSAGFGEAAPQFATARYFEYEAAAGSPITEPAPQLPALPVSVDVATEVWQV